MKENPSFLKEQIITYLGNKRALLGFLNKGFKVAKKELNQDKFSFCDVFSGSGVVSRFAKAHSHFIIANDLE
ncbi:DNA adenine methylase, partial [Campylobacter coli]|nr:DNA adenine methylase [Campylobacter coli]